MRRQRRTPVWRKRHRIAGCAALGPGTGRSLETRATKIRATRSSAVHEPSFIPLTREQPFAVGVGLAAKGVLPRPVEVLLLQRSIPTVAHAVRISRRGHQTLVSLSGHLWWVPSNRVVDRGQPPEV